jgi:ATP-binding cassette, subfamily A (ABC1), member 3
MSLGMLQCVGTSQFLKTTYGAGYNLIFDTDADIMPSDIAQLTDYVRSGIPGAVFDQKNSHDVQTSFTLPFDSVKHFGEFFTRLQIDLPTLRGVKKFGVMITSLEDVFLKVGEDHSVKRKGGIEQGIGSTRSYNSNFLYVCFKN